jgi:hypothetical protein
MFFSSREKRGPDLYLEWKVRIFFAGALLALIGIGIGSSVLVGLAILVLLVGVGLRFLPGGGGKEGGAEEVPEPDDADGMTPHREQDSGSPPDDPPAAD